jgi:hypothetical protein
MSTLEARADVWRVTDRALEEAIQLVEDTVYANDRGIGARLEDCSPSEVTAGLISAGWSPSVAVLAAHAALLHRSMMDAIREQLETTGEPPALSVAPPESFDDDDDLPF